MLRKKGKLSNIIIDKIFLHTILIEVTRVKKGVLFFSPPMEIKRSKER